MTVIAMTRQLGCLGAEVASGIAGRLGLKTIHSEIVANNVAERLGVEEGTVRRYVDGSASLFERLVINKRKLSRYTAEEILRIAQHGNVLIRGWGAATLLRDMPQVISVRVCASMDFRVGVLMKRTGSRNAAQPRFRDRAMTRTALANKLLEAKVTTALTEEIGIGIAPTGVAVSAANGRITLVATSSSGALRARAEKVAHRVAGVHQIDNRIVSVPSRGGAF
jgi:cytidylate kinase